MSNQLPQNSHVVSPGPHPLTTSLLYRYQGFLLVASVLLTNVYYPILTHFERSMYQQLIHCISVGWPWGVLNRVILTSYKKKHDYHPRSYGVLIWCLRLVRSWGGLVTIMYPSQTVENIEYWMVSQGRSLQTMNSTYLSWYH